MKLLLSFTLLFVLNLSAIAQEAEDPGFGASWSMATRIAFIGIGIISLLLALRTFKNKPDA